MPSTASTPSSFLHSIFSTTDTARLTLPRSATTTPATIYSNSPAASTLRDAEKAARKLAEDRLAEEIASHAKTQELLLKERERHRKAESAGIKACDALEKENADLEATLLDLRPRGRRGNWSRTAPAIPWRMTITRFRPFRT